MCVFRRIERLRETLADLASQKGVAVRLHLWNNNWAARGEVDRIVAEAPVETSVVHSRENTGGFGRFYIARALARSHRDAESPVVFIDDDQGLGDDAILRLTSEFRPGTITGVWAFAFESGADYWARQEVEPGREADYVGTGGMVSPLWLYGEKGLFRCPARYWFVEDLWLSFYASHLLGFRLVSSSADITMVKDGRDQWVGLQYVKTRFLRYLVNARGWGVGT
jgi:hypothetical protein